MSLVYELRAETTKYSSEWGSEEDKFLKTLLTIGELHDWSQVTFLMGIRFPEKTWSTAECKERWNGIVNAPDSKKSWSMSDELEVLVVHKLCGNNWSAASELLQGRSNNSIKNRFYSIFRKIVSKVKRMETKYSCQIELLEILYILSLMKHHISNPSSFIIKKGRRGKDFIYNLMKNIYTENIEKFESALNKLAGEELSLERVWTEVAGPLELSKFHLPKDVKRMITMCNLIHGINDALTSKNRSITKLPEIDFSTNPRGMTKDEKEFIQTQAFSLKQTTEASSLERSGEYSENIYTKQEPKSPRLNLKQTHNRGVDYNSREMQRKKKKLIEMREEMMMEKKNVTDLEGVFWPIPSLSL